MSTATERLQTKYNGRYYDEITNPGGLDGPGGMEANYLGVAADVAAVGVEVATAVGAVVAAQSTVSMIWDAGTAAADPGEGRARATTAAPAVGSYSLLVSVTDAAGTGIGDMLTDLGASSSAAKARARLVKVGDAGKYLDLQVTGVSGSGAYRTVAVACIGGPGGFAAGDTVAIGWTRTGDKGDVGGASLPPGSVAAPGLAVTGDSNTGIAQVGGADTLSAVVAAIESMRWVPGAVHLNPGHAAYNPAIWLMGPSAGEDYSVQRDAATGYLILNGLQTAASGYSIRVNNGTERLRIPNTGPIELEATKFRGPATAKQGAIAYAATLTLDFATYQDFAVGDLTGPLTLANPSTYPVGQRGEILLHEDATGGRTVSFGANWIKMGNGTVNTAAGKYSVITYWIVSSSVIIYSIAGGA